MNFKKRMVRFLAVWMMMFFVGGILGCSKGPAAPQGSSVPASASAGNGKITVKVLDVGQGDAVLIRTAKGVTLVDTGDVSARDKLVALLKKENVTTIDNMIITHPHADHMGGCEAVLNNWKVSQVYDSGQTTTGALFRQYLGQVKSKGIPFTVLRGGMQIDLGEGASLQVLHPDQSFITGTDSDLNNNSIVMRLRYGSFSMLLTGDAEQAAEEKIGEKYRNELKSQVLKSGHHGSNTASSPAFLKLVGAETAVISCGVDNPYHHPHPSIVKRYREMKLNVFRTDTDGTVTITSDGKTYEVTKEK